MKIIPLFFPFAGCRYRCVFCDEHLLTGQRRIPTMESIAERLGRFRFHMRNEESYQVAFYGGSFLSLGMEMITDYFETVLKNIPDAKFDGLRLSTTPNSINEDTINLLKSYPVKLVEMGVQSFDDNVLRLSKRPHSVRQVYAAAELLKSSGIEFAVHLMTGLPGSTVSAELFSAQETLRIGASECRLNPTLVLKGTELEERIEQGLYRAQSIDDAIDSLWRMYVLLEGAGVRVIRIGLCLDNTCDSDKVVAGPYHPAIGDLVLSRVAFEMLFLLCSKGKKEYILLPVTRQQRSFFTGHKRMVERLLEQSGIRVEYKIVDDAVLDTGQLLEDLRFCVSGGEVNEAFLDPPERVQELCASDEAEYIGRDHVSCRT